MQWVQAILRFLFGNAHFTGLLPDTRPQYEQEKDYLHEERAVQAPVDPFGNVKINQSPYPYINQLSTSSCVPHALALALSIERKQDVGYATTLAPMFPYRLRSNYAQEGSIPQNIADILRKQGAPLIDLLPTPQTESQANNLVLTQQMYTEAKIFKGLTYFTVKNASDITTLATIAQQGHGIAVTLFATEEEYSRQYPTILNKKLTLNQAEVRHEVCILPESGFIENGTKYVAVQDSAWFGGWKLRYLSEEFIYNRVYGAIYFDTVNVLSSGPKPVHKFTKTLSYGASGEEVKYVQQLLVSEGLLPSDCVTGYFGGITLAGVRAFQAKYANDILIPNGLTTPTGYWGSFCIAKANALCGQ